MIHELFNFNETVNCDLVLRASTHTVRVRRVGLFSLRRRRRLRRGAMRAAERRDGHQAAGARSSWRSRTVFSHIPPRRAEYWSRVSALLRSLPVSRLIGSALVVDALAGGDPAGAAGRRGRRAFLVGGAVAVVGFIAISFWAASGGGAENLSKAELVEQKPEFSRWYMNLPVTPVSSEGGHRKGGAASVVMIEFSDFECGHCARAFRNLKTVLPRFGTTRWCSTISARSSCIQRHGPAHRSMPLRDGIGCAAERKFWSTTTCSSPLSGARSRHPLLYAEQLSIDRSKLSPASIATVRASESSTTCAQAARSRTTPTSS